MRVARAMARLRKGSNAVVARWWESLQARLNGNVFVEQYTSLARGVSQPDGA
jgi:hypothetical protein